MAAQPADLSPSLDDVACSELDAAKPGAMTGKSPLAGGDEHRSKQSRTCNGKRVCDSPSLVSPSDSQTKRLKTSKMADLTSVCSADEATVHQSSLEHLGRSMRSVYSQDYYPVLISALAALPPTSATIKRTIICLRLIVGKDAGGPPVDLPLVWCLSIPVWLLRDIFLHLDVYTRSRLMRVNWSWKCELETLRVEQKCSLWTLPSIYGHSSIGSWVDRSSWVRRIAV